MTVPKEFDRISFKGGLYAVARGIDRQTDQEAMKQEIDRFVSENGFQRDPSRPELGNIITASLAKAIMVCEQTDYDAPIQGRE